MLLEFLPGFIVPANDLNVYVTQSTNKSSILRINNCISVAREPERNGQLKIDMRKIMCTIRRCTNVRNCIYSVLRNSDEMEVG